jgi:hypothetical protein
MIVWCTEPYLSCVMHVLVDDMLFLTLLLWYILSYASRFIAHHTNAPCVVCNDLGGAYSKYVQLAFEATIVEEAHI